MSDGWNESASAWIAEQGKHGDFSREFVLDTPMLERVMGRGFKTGLDVGCGEGRFCRMLQANGIRTVGIDPTKELIQHARKCDPDGDYRLGRAECLEFPDRSFDLVVSYLSLIDIPDIATAIPEMARVLRPGGTLLIANLTSFSTAAVDGGWIDDGAGNMAFRIDHYLKERAEWVGWRGIRIQNWHRPLSRYMTLLLEQGLNLKHFAEPAPLRGDPATADPFNRIPSFVIMEWEKNEL